MPDKKEPERVALTDRFLRTLKPTRERRTIWDLTKRNMAVQVGARGHPSFYVAYRLPGAKQPTWRRIGQYPEMTLAAAHQKADEALEAIKSGEDPRQLGEKHRAAAEAARLAEANTFAALVERFDTWYRTTPGKGGDMRRRADDVIAVINRELVPMWGQHPVRDIAKRDVKDAIEAIRLRGGGKAADGSRRSSGGPYAARHAFAAARLVFDWAWRNEYIPASPCAALSPDKDLHVSPAPRERVLADAELPPVWAAADATPYPYGPLIKLLLLTGARLREVAEASWTEIGLDAATLIIPTHRMKMKTAHVIPLTPTALDIVRDLPRFEGGNFLFSTTGGRRPISGFSKFRAKFNQTLAAVLKKAELPAAKPFTVHDLRRTCRTGLSTLRVLPTVAEMVIGHQQAGIAKVYDLHRFDEEKREALEKWEAKLLSIVAPGEPKGDVVVPMRRRRR